MRLQGCFALGMNIVRTPWLQQRRPNASPVAP